MNVQPRDRTRDHGYWDDFHTIWDTWKTVFPMYSMLYPKKMSAIIESFIDRAHANRNKNNGVVIADEFSTAHEFLAGQGGNDVDNAIVDAYLRGVKLDRYNWEDAYEVLLWSAEKMRSPEYVERGFATNNRMTVSGLPYTIRFKSAAATMGFAFNDKAIANMAREIGSAEEYCKYEKRSANWLNVWNKNAESEGFVGFPQSPLDDGSFEDGFDPHGGYNSHFYEATAWDAQYINYNDVGRMVEAMGGRELFIKRLLWACEHSVNYYNDDEGAEGYLNFTNEPSFHIPWLFCTSEIRRPDLASRVIDDIIKRFSLENDYPGDEDNGGMSSYYVFLMCGFFPYSTTDKCYLHGTRLDKITFRLGNGNVFTVLGENVGEGNIYIQSATWRGEALNSCEIDFKEILKGGELKFVMGDKPSSFAQL
jgi:predicted alpha-1,2-mannosidase